MAACQEIRNQLAPRAAGRLAPDEEAEVAAHLAACPACRAEAEEIAATMAMLRRELVPTATPSDLAAGVLARLHAPKRASSRILTDPRYQALAQPVGEKVKSGFKRSTYFVAASLFLNAAAAVILVALFLKLGDSDGNGERVCLSPDVADVPDDGPLARPRPHPAVQARESRAAILTRGIRGPAGEVSVSIAQFVDDAVLTLRQDEQLGCLKAFFPAAKESGVACAVAKARLVIPAGLAGIFGDDLGMRVVEMDDCLEIWPQRRWQALEGGAVALAAPGPQLQLAVAAPLLACLPRGRE